MNYKLRFCLLALLCGIVAVGQERAIDPDTSVTTKHKVTIGGQLIEYDATAGTQPVWDENGIPIATLFYTYYKRTNIKDGSSRPLLISFNGGPGSASVWMHIAYTGPRVLKIDDEGYPVQPYGILENEHSVLDVADIVYVNPVNTGYSRIIESYEDKKVDRKLFFGVNADISYLAEWLNTFVSRVDKWTAPKYLIGESYGGTRVSGLALELQNAQWMYLNGVILVSPADYKVLRVGGPVSSALDLPYFTAAAWHHGMLTDELQSRDLLDILPDSEDFAVNDLIPALSKGGFIDDDEKIRIAERMSFYSGLSTEVILQSNLDVPAAFFWKELKRKDGFTVGRLDSRYLGVDVRETGDRTDYNPEITSWLHSFTPAINHYLKSHLNFKTDVKYNVFGSVRPWDSTNDNTRSDLRQAMAQNPYLNVMYQTGYYDGATTYFKSKFSMWQLDPSGKFKDRMEFHGYRSGHMMYLRREDLKAANEDLRRFILKTMPEEGKAAKY